MSCYEEQTKGLEVLELIRQDVYNTTRPDAIVIGELIQVIKYLDNKLTNTIHAVSA